MTDQYGEGYKKYLNYLIDQGVVSSTIGGKKRKPRSRSKSMSRVKNTRTPRVNVSKSKSVPKKKSKVGMGYVGGKYNVGGMLISGLEIVDKLNNGIENFDYYSDDDKDKIIKKIYKELAKRQKKQGY